MAAPLLAVTESVPNLQAFESESDLEGLVQRQNESLSWSKARWFVPVALSTLGILAGALHQGLHQGQSLRADVAASIVKAKHYSDQLTDSTIFSDNFKFSEVCGGLVYEVHGRYVKKDSEGGKSSEKYVVEDPEGGKSSEVVGDILDRFNLILPPDEPDKRQIRKLLGAYLQKLMQQNPAGDIKKGGRPCVDELLEKGCDLYYPSEDVLDKEGMPILVQPGDDVSPGGDFSVYVWKDGLKITKV